MAHGINILISYNVDGMSQTAQITVDHERQDVSVRAWCRKQFGADALVTREGKGWYTVTK